MRSRRRSLACLLVAVTAGCSTDPAADAPPGPETIRFTATSAELERRDRPADDDDLRILHRAVELLRDQSAWNPQDDRVCIDDERNARRSLFCALHQASLDVRGEYDHRRVALQEVRFAIEDATGGQAFEHRLRDYNNLPDTGLAEIRQVLQVAIARVEARVGHAP